MGVKDFNRGEQDAAEGRSRSQPCGRPFESEESYQERHTDYKRGYEHTRGQQDAAAGESHSPVRGAWESEESYDTRVEAYKAGHDSGSNNDSGGGGCFVTTACVTAMNLPDDCEELEIMRAYREIYLRSTPDKLADLEHYNAIGPVLVAKIRTLPNSTEIYQEVYKSIILPCVSMIKAGLFDEARHFYMDKVLHLHSHLVHA